VEVSYGPNLIGTFSAHRSVTTKSGNTIATQDHRMRKRSGITLLVALCVLTLIAGCATKPILERNMASGHKLGMLFRVNDEMNSDSIYPTTLETLRSQLRAKGIEDAIPKCECKDGQLLDFIYVAGFDSSDSKDWAFLFSPPEMHLDKAIVVFLDGNARAVNQTEAEKLMMTSRAFIAQSRRSTPDKAVRHH
jgi:hypothetical protein